MIIKASKGNETMSNLRTACILTLSYWIAAVLFATFAPRGGWIDLRWPIAIYFFAIPVTILLWLVVAGVHLLRPGLPRTRFAVIGIVLPFVYAAVAAAGGRWLSESREQQLEAQLQTATVATFEDEPLNGSKGPIGVRLRYRVVYPRGLDLDEDHGAFSQLFTASKGSTFVMARRAVAPRVSGRYPPGTYEITEDFVPVFLPPSILYPMSEPGASDHCFRWSAGMSREDALSETAEPLAVRVYLSHVPIQRSTKLAYRLADFYAAAMQEGAMDCAKALTRRTYGRPG
jgi:hypothetical protein